MTTPRTLKEKIGALICPRVFGDREGWDCFDFPKAQEFVEEYPPETFIVIRGERETTRKLLNWIGAEIVPRPPLFCADLEEGPGQQIKGATRFPPMMALGASRNAELARKVAAAMTQESREIGIAWLLSPVLDLAHDPRNPVIGSRSLGQSAELAETLGAAFIEGIRQGGGMSSAKHFPGHGSTPIDSHETLAKVSLSLEELESSDLRPFRAAVRAGVSSVMIGHLAVPALEPDISIPASLSTKVIEGYLRNKLGYEGVVLTDALVMGAVHGKGDPDLLGLLALEAGNDLILMPTDPLGTAKRIEEAVKKGAISEKRLDRSLHRISKMRTTAFGSAPSTDSLIGEERLDLSLARSSVTLIDKKFQFRSFAQQEGVHLQIWNETRDGEQYSDLLKKELLKHSIPQRESGRPLIVVFSDNRAWRGRAGLEAHAQEQIHQALKSGKNPVLLAFCSPFAMSPFLDQCPVLLNYGVSPATLQAGVEALIGKISPSGTLPVKVS